jgi:DNA-binding transcriptional regulator YdaS (Cro superfamily)
LDEPSALMRALSVAEMLRTNLDELGWSTGRLHRAVALRGRPSRVTVWQWVKGRRAVLPHHVNRIAEVLGWPDEARAHAHYLAGVQRASKIEASDAQT